MQRDSQIEVRKILLLAANPKGTPPLRLDEELRRITDALERSKKRDEINIQVKTAVTITHIRRAILDHQPEIVHFCGHGAGTDGIACEDETRQLKLIPTFALANLFELVAAHVKCVILNACYSEFQANEIAKHVECVVGMKYDIGDNTALSFAEGFYDALGVGKAFDECFRFGVNAIQLENIPEDSRPVLKKNGMTYRPTDTSHHRAPDKVKRPTSEPMHNRKPWKILLASLFVVALVAAAILTFSQWALPSSSAPLESSIPATTTLTVPSNKLSLVGNYWQRFRAEDELALDSDKKIFQIHPLASSLMIYIDRNGKLGAVEVSTHEIRYYPDANNREQHMRIGAYTAEWSYDENDIAEKDKPVFSNGVKMHGRFARRNGFDLLLPDDLSQLGIDKDKISDYRGLLSKIPNKYRNAQSEIHMTDGGELERDNRYIEIPDVETAFFVRH